MNRPHREAFILDIRRAAREIERSWVDANAKVGIDTNVKIHHGTAGWLTPELTVNFDVHDFHAWSPSLSAKLQLTVTNFRKVADQAVATRAPHVELIHEGKQRLSELVEVLGEMVREEWLHAIDEVEAAAETWATEQGWRCRRVNKSMHETLLGTYLAPQLLIYAEPHLFVLDPIARFIPGGQGAFDLAIQPSYHTNSLHRDDEGMWRVSIAADNGIAPAEQIEWNKNSFLKCFEQLEAWA